MGPRVVLSYPPKPIMGGYGKSLARVALILCIRAAPTISSGGFERA